jgi:hypothetical protein
MTYVLQHTRTCNHSQLRVIAANHSCESFAAANHSCESFAAANGLRIIAAIRFAADSQLIRSWHGMIRSCSPHRRCTPRRCTRARAPAPLARKLLCSPSTLISNLAEHADKQPPDHPDAR